MTLFSKRAASNLPETRSLHSFRQAIVLAHCVAMKEEKTCQKKIQPFDDDKTEGFSGPNQYGVTQEVKPMPSNNSLKHFQKGTKRSFHSYCNLMCSQKPHIGQREWK